MTKLLKENFEKKFFKIVKTRNIKKIEHFLSNSNFNSFSLEYKQSVLDYFVYSDYKFPDFTLAKWALHTNITGLIGNVHENANRPLRLAAQYNTNYTKYLLTCPTLQKKADINETNDGSSALLEAIKTKNLSLVQFLTTSPDLETKARIDLADNDFDDPLCKACEVNDINIVKYLLTNHELYTNLEDFNPSIYLTKFDYNSIRKIILRDNLELFTFIVEEKLVDILPDLHNWFCTAVIVDAKNITTYLEKFFIHKPDLLKLQYNDHSLFYAIAQVNHYSRMHQHSYLHSILEQGEIVLTPEEVEKMHWFYVYNENNTCIKLSTLMEKYQQKHNFEQKFPPKNIIEKKIKI